MKAFNYVLVVSLLVGAVQAETALAIPDSDSNHNCIFEWFSEQIKPYFYCFWPAILFGFSIGSRMFYPNHQGHIRKSSNRLLLILENFTQFYRYFCCSRQLHSFTKLLMPCPSIHSLGLKLSWTCPNWFGHVRNVLDRARHFEHGSKCEMQLWKVVFGLVHNFLRFGPIEGQGNRNKF